MGKNKRSRDRARKRRGGTTAGERLAQRLARVTEKAATAANDYGLAEVAWQRWTHTLPGPHSPWAELAEEFLEETKPSRPEEACAVLLLALDNAPGWPAFVDAGWVSLAGAHVYCYFDGSGYGHARVYQLVERFVRWMHERERLSEWDTRRLLGCIDAARAAHSVATRGYPAVQDPTYRRAQLDELHAAFVHDVELEPGAELDETNRRLTRTVLERVANALHQGTWRVRFGGLEPEDLVRELRVAADRYESVPPAIVAKVKAHIDTQVFDIAACFYRWLAVTGRLDADRADELSTALEELADEARSGPSLG